MRCLLLDDLKTGLQDLEDVSTDHGKLVGERGENGDGSEGGDAEVEVPAQLVGSGVMIRLRTGLRCI